MADILIIVGTESGNSQMVADLLEEELPALGHTVEVFNNGEASDAKLDDRDVVLVCCSTHGDGELPDNIIPFAESLEKAAPDLGHIRYGVIALGDQTYHDTFCGGGKTMDALLARLGATRIGDRLEIDACVQPLPDEDALEWAKEWVALL
jgi:MioC protein